VANLADGLLKSSFTREIVPPGEQPLGCSQPPPRHSDELPGLPLVAIFTRPLHEAAGPVQPVLESRRDAAVAGE